MKTSLILASGSPRRRELLAKLKIPFEVKVASITELPESAAHGLTPAEFCWANALRKGRAVARIHPRHYTLCADTVVTLGTKLFGKPKDLAEASHFLFELSGKTHEVFTAVHLFSPGGRRRGFIERTQVVFRHLNASTIDVYLATVHVLDKAGGYALQERGDWIIERVIGSESNVIGLPLDRVRELLRPVSQGK